jgi:secernin
MCDTLVAVGEATADGTVILAKSSDREPNEAQVLTHVPRAKHASGARVKCTYIEIPQVPETNEILLSRPFWMWGAEMGANEHGVAIGNEAVFTREPYGKDPGLIGMDMLRLALERANTARRALDVIVELLETYGQSGNCGFQHKTYYHNAFLIADAGEAWLLETAGRFWAARRVRAVCTISNGLTIGGEWDLASPGLVAHAVEKGWCKAREDFDFARCYSDLIYTRLDGCRARQRRSTELLQAQRGRITAETMMAALRDHGIQAAADPTWNPGRGWLMETLCVHATVGPTRPSQSVGSMVVHLTPGGPAVWVTGTSAPCTGIFKPVYLGGAGLPALGPEPTGTYDPDSLWWSHERLHRAVIRDYPTRLPLYRDERDALEAEFVRQAEDLHRKLGGMPAGERRASMAAFTASCFERAATATARWEGQVSSMPIRYRPPWLFSMAWDRFLARQSAFGTRSAAES